ncbi:MAG: hypothetical protein V3T70_03655, partial [Phycisphaerae bacterium]
GDDTSSDEKWTVQSNAASSAVAYVNNMITSARAQDRAQRYTQFIQISTQGVARTAQGQVASYEIYALPNSTAGGAGAKPAILGKPIQDFDPWQLAELKG